MSLCIGLIAPGQMGSSLGKLILSHSTSAAPIRVITDLSKRSIRSQNLAKSAGIEDVSSLLKVVQQASIILSVLNPSEAIGLARLIVETLKVGEKNSMNFKYFVDLNAIAPSTSQAIANLFQATSIKCVDGGILGGPATNNSCPLIVLSGEGSDFIHSTLSAPFLGRIKVVGERIGQASAVKLSFAALNKGSIALALNVGLLAEEWDVRNHLESALEDCGSAMLKTLRNSVPQNVAKAHRWIGEMEEISKSFEDMKVDGGAAIYKGTAGTWRFVADSEVGKESIEEALAKNRPHTEVLSILKQKLKDQS